MTIAVNLYLLVMSFCDIKYRKVPLIGLVLFFFSGLIYNVFFSDMSITLWLGGILTGFSFLFISGTAEGISIKNAKYLLDNAIIKSDDQYGISNQVLPN